MLLEVCVNSYESALNAQKGGADRIELCSELFLGGITPSFGLIQKVKDTIQIPVHVLIRPRSGNFTYNTSDFEVIKQDIIQCKKMGCEGVVCGMLLANHTIDTQRIGELVAIAAPMTFTFHRAFDWVVNPEEALMQLGALKVDRILTSGQQKKAETGIELLKKLLKLADDKIIVMPGSGIQKNNILKFKEAGFKEIHFSASSKRKSQTSSSLPMISSSSFDESELTFSDVKKIKIIRELVK